MARPSTIKPTNTAISYPAYSSSADVEVLNTDFGNITEAVNLIADKMIIPQAFSGDCNDIRETCIVYVMDGATHSPGAWSILVTLAYARHDAIIQVSFSVIDRVIKTRSLSAANPGGGWSDWSSQDLQIMVVSSVSNLQATLLAKAQTMGSEEIENIKLIFNGSNEGVFANGNYYCGWIAINSKGSDYLYFSGVIKGLWGADTIEFTYANGTWSFHKLSVIRYVDVTVPVGTTAGAYKVGTFSSLNIPYGSALLCAQCINATGSICPVSGLSTYDQDIYVYVIDTVQVANGTVRISYMI